MVKYLVCLCFVFFASFVHAEQKKIFDGPDGSEYDFHYIAFASTFLEPEVARQYKLVRSKAIGVINLSLIQRFPDQTRKAVPMFVKGKATNELQQPQFLNFTEIVEGDSVYYIAQVPFSEGKFLQFDFEVFPEGTNKQLVHRFSHAFYN